MESLRDQMSKELERIARRDPLHPITAQEKDLLREGSTKFSQSVMDHLTLRLPLNPVFNGFLHKLYGLKGPHHPLSGLVH